MQRVHGYDIRHEALGEQGIVSWSLLLDERYIGPTWAEVQAALPDAIVRHQVREPLAVLLSMHKITSRGMNVLRRLVGYNGPTTEMLMRAYLELNRRAEELTDDRYKVEDAAQIYPYFTDRPAHRNSRRHRAGHPVEMAKVDPKTAEKFVEMGERYGYDMLKILDLLKI